jgi:peroxiredoxin Q/BCP
VIEEGTPAPGFELPNESGEPVSLAGLRGRPVVLFFYPKDDTPGCTKEACSFRDEYHRFVEQGAVVLGVSPDSEKSHVKFRAKFELPCSLLADTEHAVCKAYDVWREKSMYGKKYWGVFRSTFVIGADGTVVKAMYGVKPEGHAQEVLAALTQQG